MNRSRIPSTCLVSLILISLLGLVAPAALAQSADESAIATSAPIEPGPSPIFLGVPPIEGLLFAGTSTNVNDPAGTANDVFTVDTMADTSTSILSGVGVWGATADIANERVLFTRASGLTPPPGLIGGGDELFAVPYAGGMPTSLGRIVNAAGEGVRIDGLAISGGVLYGAEAGGGATNGLFMIDMGTLVATQVALYTDSISGIDADPDTGIIYGVNDTTGQLVTVGTDGTITNVAPYPAGLTDIDGIAVGGGFAYLVTDESQAISVYDIAGGAFVAPLTSPFAAADTFSGAAFAVPGGPTSTPLPVPTLGTYGLIALILLLVVVAVRRING